MLIKRTLSFPVVWCHGTLTTGYFCSGLSSSQMTSEFIFPWLFFFYSSLLFFKYGSYLFHCLMNASGKNMSFPLKKFVSFLMQITAKGPLLTLHYLNWKRSRIPWVMEKVGNISAGSQPQIQYKCYLASTDTELISLCWASWELIQFISKIPLHCTWMGPGL